MRNTGGIEYLALRPLLADYVLSMPRGAAVVYPKDAGQIVAMADIFPGARVVEAGVGSGALTMSLLRAVGDHGLLHSYERRATSPTSPGGNVETLLRRPAPGLAAHRRRPRTSSARTRPDVDRVVLDMLAPWECLDAVADGAGARRRADLLRRDRHPAVPDRRGDPRRTAASPSPAAWESMVRGWHLEGLAVRPEHRMVGPHRLPAHHPPAAPTASTRRCAAAARPAQTRDGGDDVDRGLAAPGRRRTSASGPSRRRRSAGHARRSSRRAARSGT